MDTSLNGIFSLEFEVRDYECDLQGWVNNAVYMHYLEHTRHRFLKSVNLDFAALHDEGTDGMVVRTEIDYKHPLKSGDTFLSVIGLRENGALRLDFLQEILLLPDRKPVVRATVTTVLMKNGRPLPIRKVFGDLKTLEVRADGFRPSDDGHPDA